MTARQPISVNNQEDGRLDFSVRLMEHLVVPTFVLDADCRVIIWNKACERLTGVKASEVIGTQEHWRGFYDAPRPCLADLIAQGRTAEIDALYADHDHAGEDAIVALGRRAENWCVMPQAGTRLYLAIDAGPIYDDAGKLIAVVETLRDMTVQKEAQAELERLATRESRALSLLMIDVYFFKPYNDTYGHQGGDECLRQVAAAMSGVVMRSSDAVARYGGEEFAILLPATDPEGACIVAERIRAAIEALQLPHSGSTVADHVTVSIGVASAAVSSGDVPEQLVGAADEALYRAKHEGRNRVVLAGRAADPAAQPA